MTVVVIHEDIHGMIGVAKDYKSAINFLYKDHWIDDETVIYNSHDVESSVIHTFGKNWFDILSNEWNIEKFNDFWFPDYYLVEEKVLGTE